MERWRVTAMAALCAGGVVPVAAQVVPVPVVPATGAPSPVADTPRPPTLDEIELAFASVQDRMTVPVRIGLRGPWRFVIDTGAERSVIARELANALDLPRGPALRVTAMTDTVSTASATVTGLSIDAIRPDPITAPLLEARDLGALGLIGVDALQGRQVGIDFDKGVMTVRPSRRRRVSAGVSGDEIVVVAKSLYGQLIVTNAEWNGKRIAVIVDTGSPMTIGNTALFRLVRRPPRALGPMLMTSATGADLAAPGYVIDGIGLGGVQFRDLAVVIADVVPFRRFGLADEPALLLGMNGLRLFRRVDIDFANRAIRLTLPRAAIGRMGMGL